jgi:DNA-binding response OmpR family regulator
MLEAEGADYRALITDVNLPGTLSGWDVAKRGREINGELPVIYITGAADGDWPSNGVPKSILLVKPFVPAQVVTAVAQLLNASSGSES